MTILGERIDSRSRLQSRSPGNQAESQAGLKRQFLAMRCEPILLGFMGHPALFRGSKRFPLVILNQFIEVIIA
jgi:hypothetical protein